MKRVQNRQRKHTVLLIVLAVGMFGFAFTLAPLYDIFCELTGLNGKTAGRTAYTQQIAAPSDREVTIQFLAHVGKGMPWEFRPMESRLRVRPGEMHTTNFYVRNRAGGPVTGQAVPSVTPGLAAQHLHKVECFCFVQQRLEAGEEMEMPVTFYIGNELPAKIATLSLSYTLFRVQQTARRATDRNRGGEIAESNEVRAN